MMTFIVATLLAAASPTPTPKPAATPAAKPAAAATAKPAATPAAKAAATPAAKAAAPAASSSSSASAGSPAALVALKLGASVPSGKLGLAPGFAVEVRKPLAMEERLGAFGEIGYFSTSASGTETNPQIPNGVAWKVGVTEFPIVVGGFFRQPFGKLGLSGTAGLIVAPMTARASAGGGTNTEGQTSVGGMLAVGVDAPLGPGAIVGELGFAMLPTNLDATGSGNGMGPGFRVGYRVGF